MNLHQASTEAAAYTERLSKLSGIWWKRLLRPADPYLWSLRVMRLGRTLDVGCGIGRNLVVLPPGSLGVDHNADSVAHARARGLDVVTLEEFQDRALALGSFDTLLIAHVLEHLDPHSGAHLVRSYLPYLRSGGRVLLICPQERGYASDPTHVRWFTGDDLVTLCQELGLVPHRSRSFPLPRWVGRHFVYNEFRVTAYLPA